MSVADFLPSTDRQSSGLYSGWGSTYLRPGTPVPPPDANDHNPCLPTPFMAPDAPPAVKEDAVIVSGSPRTPALPRVVNEEYTTPRQSLFARRTKLQEYNKEIPLSVRNRFSDGNELWLPRLREEVTKGKTFLRPISTKLKVLGEDFESATPWIVVQCDKIDARKVRRFYSRPEVKGWYDASQGEDQSPVPSLKILVHEKALRVSAANTPDIYGGWSDLESLQTLCGQLIRVDSATSTRVVTLGGIVKVCNLDGEFELYGMTAGHVISGPQLDEIYSDSEDEGETFTTEEEEFYLVDVAIKEPESFGTTESNSVSGMNRDIQTPWSKIGRVSVTSMDNLGLSGNFDWALLTISPTLMRPNLLDSDFLKEFSQDHPPEGNRLVRLLSGTGGVISGTLSADLSAVMLPPSGKFTNTYNLKLSKELELQDGDCGSWVVDSLTNEVYGHVVASDIFREIYVVPLRATLSDMQQQLSAGAVQLPTKDDISIQDTMFEWSAGENSARQPSYKRVVKEEDSVHVLTKVNLASVRYIQESNALFKVTHNGHKDIVRLLLQKIYEIDSKDAESGRTPLSQSSRNGHMAIVRLLLKSGADVDPKDTQFGRTLLSWAAAGGDVKVVRLLLEKGAEIESKDIESGCTPLSWAAQSGHVAVVRLLLEKGAEIESKNVKFGYTPLLWAAQNGYVAVVRLLLEKGAEIESKDAESGRTSLSWAAQYGYVAVVRLLLEKGAEIESKDIESGRTPLLWATQNEYVNVARLLLENGAEIESKDAESGRTSLLWAAQYGYVAFVRLLLEKGAEIESKDTESGRTPLLWATQSGHEVVVRLLLKNGAEIESKDAESGRTPLSWAAQYGYVAIVQLLLKSGAEVDSKNVRSGRTPLSWATQSGHEVVVRLLLEKGAEIESKDAESGRTPLIWATQNGYVAIAQLLLEKGAEIESKDLEFGRTPLSWAAQYGYMAIVRLLLEKGAKEDTEDTRSSRTPLPWAAESRHKEGSEGIYEGYKIRSDAALVRVREGVRDRAQRNRRRK